MRIKEAIKQKGLTVREVALRLGITTCALNQSIAGNPSVKALTKIAKAIDVPVWQLLASPEEVGTIVKVTCPRCGTEISVKSTGTKIP